MNTVLSEPEMTKVQNILMQQLAVERAQIVPEALIEADLQADSLDKVEIAMAVEEVFNVTIADEDMEKVETVADLYGTLGDVLHSTGQPL